MQPDWRLLFERTVLLYFQCKCTLNLNAIKGLGIITRKTTYRIAGTRIYKSYWPQQMKHFQPTSLVAWIGAFFISNFHTKRVLYFQQWYRLHIVWELARQMATQIISESFFDGVTLRFSLYQYCLHTFTKWTKLRLGCNSPHKVERLSSIT